MKSALAAVAIIVAIVWAFVLAFPAVGTADPPRDPCAHNPTTLCGPDIDVFVEPPGANCPAGGIKIVIVRGEPDGPERTHPPKPDPADLVFYVCNGQDGDDGEPGPPGPPGPPGAGVTVDVEPAGENCPAGGIVVTVPDNDDEGTAPQVFYVCNGRGRPGRARRHARARPAHPARRDRAAGCRAHRPGRARWVLTSRRARAVASRAGGSSSAAARP